MIMLGGLIGLGASLLGGWLGKKVGKSRKVGGGTPYQKGTAPVGAVVAAGIAEGILSAITGEPPSGANVANTSGAAIVLHSVLKNLTQLGQAIAHKNGEGG